MRGIVSVLLMLLSLSGAARAGVEERPELGRLFEAAQTHGTIVLREAGGETTVFDADRARTRLLPASTFKIPAALIALETGVVKDASKDTLPWNGVEWIVPACNQDQTLASALKRSCMPIFADLMRRVGDDRLNASLDAFDYGNRDASGDYPYWIRGNLRISAFEQIAFLERLRSGSLPASAEHMQSVREMLVLEEGEDYVLRGKTGWVNAPDPGVGWLVGWLERDGNTYLFVLNLDITERSHADARLSIVKSALKQIGAMP